MSVQIGVQLEEAGPAVVRMRLRSRGGEMVVLDRRDPALLEAEEQPWRVLAGPGLRLTRGAVDVLVAEDQLGQVLTGGQVAGAMALAA